MSMPDDGLRELLDRISAGADGNDPWDRASRVRRRAARQATVRRVTAAVAAAAVLGVGTGVVLGKLGVLSSSTDSTVSLPTLGSSAQAGGGASGSAAVPAATGEAGSSAGGSSASGTGSSASGATASGAAASASGSAAPTPSALGSTSSPSSRPTTTGPVPTASALPTGSPSIVQSGTRSATASLPPPTRTGSSGSASASGSPSAAPSPDLTLAVTAVPVGRSLTKTFSVHVAGYLHQYVDPATGAPIPPSRGALVSLVIAYGDGATGGFSHPEFGCRSDTPLFRVDQTFQYSHTYASASSVQAAQSRIVSVQAVSCTPPGVRSASVTVDVS